VKKQVIVSLCVVAALLGAAGLAGAVPHARPRLLAVVPSVVSYQGQVNLGGWPFDGKGYFKFAIVDADGSTTYWSNDGSSGAGEEPELPIELIVTDGLFNVLLGDPSVENMEQPLEADVFADPECCLRVWFSEDGGTFQQLSPDRRIASVPYALQAQEAANAGMLGGRTAGNASGRIPINNGALNTSLNADLLDGQHATELAVPSGAIVLGYPHDPRLTEAGYARLALSIELWGSTSTSGAPDGRSDHTGVWTGSKLVVWGGYDGSDYVNSGGRYAPITDMWTPTATSDAPSARYRHTAVWTGSEMVVWGGYDSSGYVNSGARYDPITDIWAPTTGTNAPSARIDHTAVWTGSEMIVWGGYDGGSYVNSGGRYDPITDTWTPITTTSAPSGRWFHTAVWTGSEMIVWGGAGSSPSYKCDGARYDPATDSWSSITTTVAPAARAWHTAVWAGSEMIVWGGFDGAVYFDSGVRYKPITDTWTPITTSGAPEARSRHTAVWTGSDMIVWGGTDAGGDLNTGGRYDPITDAWRPITAANAPERREHHTAVWTGSQMIIWGGVHQMVPLPSFLHSGGSYASLHLYQKP
jgi:N-acetylneuraminic acid mutarotase